MTEPIQVASRLVVELHRRAAADMAWCAEYESLNKTTITNRAVQVYRKVMEHQANGGRIALIDADGKTDIMVIL